MNKRHHTKLIQEGKYVAEVDVELIANEEGWSPYISVEDAYKLDDIRDALQQGDIKKASQFGRIFQSYSCRCLISPSNTGLLRTLP